MKRELETNEKHANDPQVGDYWNEHCVATAVVVSRPDKDTVCICRTKRDGMTWDLRRIEVMPVSEFSKWVHYNTCPGTWCDVYPRHSEWVADAAKRELFGENHANSLAS